MNKTILLGNLTRDPELRFLPSSVAVVNFGMAMNERWTDQQTGEQRENVCFVECEAWNRQAEVINEHLKKGSQILVEGSLKFEQWQGDDGTNRNRLKVRVQRFEFVGPRLDENGNRVASEYDGGNGNGRQQPANNQRQTPQNAPPAPTQGTPGDDVPF